MTYLPSIPQAPDFLSVSQGQILANFTQLNAIFGVDHVFLNTNTSLLPSGYHTAIHMVPQNNPATKNGFGILYSKQITSIATTALLYKDGPPSSNGTPKGVAYCQSATVVVPATSTVNIIDIIGNVSGYINFFISSSVNFYSYAFYQRATAPLKQGLTNFGPVATGIIKWSSATPATNVTLQFNNTSGSPITLYYTVFYTYTQ